MRLVCLTLVTALLVFPTLPVRADTDPHEQEAEAPADTEREHGDDARDRCGRKVHMDFDFDIFAWEHEDDQTRVAVLDLFIVSLVDVRSREPDYSRVELLDAPLVTGFESRRQGDCSRVRVLDIPLFSLFSSDRTADSSDVRFVELPLVGSLFRQRVDRDRRRTNVLFLFRFERPVTPTTGTGTQ